MVTPTLNHDTSQVLMPDILETVDVTADTNVYRVRLSDALLSALHFHKVGQYELAYVDAELTGGGVGSNLALVPLPADRVKGHRAVFVCCCCCCYLQLPLF
jgi:cleavage and polyadenylation specificity factor subunit 2